VAAGILQTRYLAAMAGASAKLRETTAITRSSSTGIIAKLSNTSIVLLVFESFSSSFNLSIVPEVFPKVFSFLSNLSIRNHVGA
jgi:hypothetical protein